MTQVIPITSTPNQTINVTLSVDGNNLPMQLGFSFNESAGYWAMSVMDPTTQTMLLASVPLVTGAAPAGNILAQYAYLSIGSAIIVNATGVAMDYPGGTNLGTDFQLVWGDTL